MRKEHSYSPPALDAVLVLGLQIASARRARRWSQGDLAERAGTSVNTLRSVEQGAPTVAIGIFFDLAVLLGVDLYGTEPGDMAALVTRGRERLALLPSRVRARSTSEVEEDF